MDGVLAFLDSVGGTVTTLAITGLVLINGAFVAWVALRRDRGAVNRLTKPLVVADAVLLLAAGGAPVATWALKTGVRTVAAVMPGTPGPAVEPAQEIPVSPTMESAP